MKIEENDKKLYKLEEEYPWLNVTTTIEEYVEPTYYEKLLKDYKFNNNTDLEIFENYLKSNNFNGKKILELGCGSGRVTELIYKNISDLKLNVLDLSKQMLNFTKRRFTKDGINVINLDTIDYLHNCGENYDFVYSLWSYSHSVHQHLTKLGMETGCKYVTESLRGFIKDNLNREGKMFVIHFDSLSDEQRILIAQWKKVYPIFMNSSIQSPSFNLTRNILEDLKKEGVIDFNINHFVGEGIVYNSMNEALEIFMNFHMESYFNKEQLRGEVVKELLEYFENFKDNEKIKIKPGCFIIEVIKK